MGVWGDEEIIVDLAAGRIAVRGPIEFVSEIDWLRVEAVALLLARALGPVDALKVAVWREYRGWLRRVVAKKGSSRQPVRSKTRWWLGPRPGRNGLRPLHRPAAPVVTNVSGLLRSVSSCVHLVWPS